MNDDNLQANPVVLVFFLICAGFVMFFWAEINLKYEFNKWVFPLGLLAIMAAFMYITFTAEIAYKTKDGSDVGQALKDMRRSTWKNMEPWLIGLGVIFGWIGIGVALLYIGYRMDEGGWVQFGGLMWLALGWMLFRSGGRF